MFLVDNDQTGMWKRREDGRARAQDHLGPTLAGAQPGAGARALGEVGVQHVHVHAQARTQPCHGLRRQADLRHQQQALAARGQGAFDQVDVDLGLAAAGDAVQQERREAAEAVADGVDGFTLAGVELGSGLARSGVRIFLHGETVDQSGLVQSSRSLAPARQQHVQFARVLLACDKQVKQGAAASAAACGLLRVATGLGQPPGFLSGGRPGLVLAQQGGQGVQHHVAGGAEPVVGGPGQGGQQFGIQQGRRIQHALHALELVCGPGALHPGLDHHPDLRAATERHLHARAGRGIVAVPGRQVIEQARQRDRQGNTQDGGHAAQCSRGVAQTSGLSPSASPEIRTNLHRFPWKRS